ncbi:MAG: PLDc N-terminal domain-containing protein [Planctomycetaceae bacterium]|nr:PLDc N-terminal domain-containing protein [Planctomycetaceae bacterium]
MSHLFELTITNPLWWIGSHFLMVAGFGLCAFLVARVFREHRTAPVTFAWLLAIVLIPYVGVPLYLLFGGRKLRGVAQHKPTLFPNASAEPHPGRIDSTVERVLTTAGMPPPRAHNRVEFLGDGQAAYRSLVSLVTEAQRSVHLMTFILGADDTGRSIVELLARKARAGVEVRLLLDALGCFRTYGRFVDPIRSAGGQVGVFMPVLPLRRKWSANLRNHRKVLVVDDNTAVVGGMNLANEYLGPEADPTRWIDTGAVIAGPAARDLERLFASDWNFATGETLPPPPAPAATLGDDDELVQIAASGPDTPRDPIYEAMFSATMDAQERIWLVTPYFVPDETLFKALALQSRLGVDVRIIIPARSNHLLADLARGQFLRDLAAEGAKIHACPRMIHAKLMLFDKRLAVVGSANVDARSMYLNFEVAATVYSPRTVGVIERWIHARIAESHPLNLAAPSLARGAAESLASLVAPLL